MATRKKLGSVLQGGAVVGDVTMVALAAIRPNPWNPNRMTARQLESLKHGLQTEGWIASQALLVWRTDERGRPRNLIIDGEHRWRMATELGFHEGPAVFLDRLTEASAKALTVKLDNRRGQFDDIVLRALLVDLQDTLDDPALDFGFEDEDYARLFALPAVDGDGSAVPDTTRPVYEGAPLPARTGQVAMIQIFFTTAQKAEWDERVQRLTARFGTSTVTDTVLAAVRAARAG